jgi:hypothetical protein
VDLIEPVTSTSGVTLAAAPQRPTRRPDVEFGINMDVDEHPARPREWRIRCQDVANRERFLTVFVEHGKVVLVGPPGESAVLSAGQLGQLRTALQEAADEAER